MSIYVYEVVGDPSLSVEAGFSHKNMHFFAQVFKVSGESQVSLAYRDAATEVEIESFLECQGVRLHDEAYEHLVHDKADAVLGLDGIDKRYRHLTPVTKFCQERGNKQRVPKRSPKLH